MGLLSVFKRIFKKDTPKLKRDGDTKAPAKKSPEEIALQQTIDRTIHCYVCGRASGFYRITLRKVSKGKYICTRCKGAGL